MSLIDFMIFRAWAGLCGAGGVGETPRLGNEAKAAENETISFRTGRGKLFTQVTVGWHDSSAAWFADCPNMQLNHTKHLARTSHQTMKTSEPNHPQSLQGLICQVLIPPGHGPMSQVCSRMALASPRSSCSKRCASCAPRPPRCTSRVRHALVRAVRASFATLARGGAR